MTDFLGRHRPRVILRLTRFSAGLLLWTVIAVGCGVQPPLNSGDGDGSDGAIFPADYRATFRLVRDCRSSSSHPSMIRVWVNGVGADEYLADANPLPEGIVVVKEEFTGTSCDDDSELASWVAMRKEAAGFDEADGDWNWQRVSSPDRRILSDTKTGCVTCHRAPECRERDYMCTEP